MVVTDSSTPASRGFWPMRDLPTAAWMLLALVAAIAHDAIPAPTWLIIHLLLLGAVTHAILVWSQYFSFALLRSRATLRDRRLQNLRLILATLGAALVCVGVPARVWILTATGAGLLVVAVVWHGASLLRRLRAGLPGRFGRTIHYYVVSAALLAVGATLGAIIARGGASNLVLSHAILNLLGWVGLTVAGTVVTLWPTILHTRADERAPRLAARALPWLAAGVAIAAVGAALSLAPVLALGLAGYVAGLVVIGISLWRAARGALARGAAARGFAALSVGAALVWWFGIAAVLLVTGIVVSATAAPFTAFSAVMRACLPYLAAGFAAQVLVGALSYLVPVALGGGPGPVRAGAAAVDRFGVPRVAAANAALIVWALPVPDAVRWAAAILYLAVMAAFLLLLMSGMRAQGRAKRAGDGSSA